MGHDYFSVFRAACYMKTLPQKVSARPQPCKSQQQMCFKKKVGSNHQKKMPSR